MKEIIRKIVIAVVVAVIAIGVAVKFIKGDEPAVDNTTTAAVAGSESEGSVSPTDSQGNAATTNNNAGAQQNPSSSDSNSAVQGGADAQTPSQGSSAQTVTDANGNTVQSVTQGSQNTQSNPGSAQQSANPQVNSQQSQQNANKIDVYQQIFSSGRFIMKINDPDLGPVTMAMSGNKMFIDASMEGVTLKMLYDGDKPDKNNPEMGTWYIVVDQIKKYSPMPADMIGDMNVEELTKDFAKDDNNNVYTKSVETIGGESYDCESTVDSNGNTTKYYFKGDVLVRSDSISPSGEVSTTEFQEISGVVDDSIFEIPEGYAKFDISWLLSMMG